MTKINPIANTLRQLLSAISDSDQNLQYTSELMLLAAEEIERLEDEKERLEFIIKSKRKLKIWKIRGRDGYSQRTP